MSFWCLVLGHKPHRLNGLLFVVCERCRKVTHLGASR